MRRLLLPKQGFYFARHAPNPFGGANAVHPWLQIVHEVHGVPGVRIVFDFVRPSPHLDRGLLNMNLVGEPV
jgi:hypothetical protein